MDSRILDTIREDHQQIEAIYNTLIHSDDPEEQAQFKNLFTWSLARHTVGEELVVFPAIEKHIRDGMETMDQNRREHQTVCQGGLDPHIKAINKYHIDQRTTQEFPRHVKQRSSIHPNRSSSHDGPPA